MKELSYQKAKEIAEAQTEECIVIGADTIVAKENEIMGKPKDSEDAFRMLQMIQGKFAVYVKGIEGDYYNVVGLPIGKVYQELKQLL